MKFERGADRTVEGSNGESVKAKNTDAAGRTRMIVISAAVAVVIGATAGFAIYWDQVRPFRTTVLIVDDASIDMRYFLKRSFLSGQAPLSVLQALSFEEIIKQVAPSPPYNIGVSVQDIDRHLRETARGENETMRESEFGEWYRQQLNDTRLSDAEYRDLVRTGLLSAGLTQYLAGRVPTVAQQVRLHVIVRPTVEDALAVRKRLDAGEDLGQLARDLNEDPRLRDKDGELGWYTRQALAPDLATAAFEDLQVGEASNPLQVGDGKFGIFVVTEKAAREVDGDDLQRAKAAVLDDWLADAFKTHKVEFHGFTNGYDSETDAWVIKQLEAMKSKSGSAQ